MASYQIKNGCLIRDDGTYIPFDPTNMDCHQFLSEVAADTAQITDHADQPVQDLVSFYPALPEAVAKIQEVRAVTAALEEATLASVGGPKNDRL